MSTDDTLCRGGRPGKGAAAGSLRRKRLPTKELGKFVSSLPGEKRVTIESVGFIHPIFEKLSSIQGCTVSVANPSGLRLISARVRSFRTPKA